MALGNRTRSDGEIHPSDGGRGDGGNGGALGSGRGQETDPKQEELVISGVSSLGRFSLRDLR